MPADAFEVLEHTADLGFRARGMTLAGLFENAALALVSIILETGEIAPSHEYPLAATGEDRESLLVNWLSEVLFYLDGRRLALARFRVDEITAGGVRGAAYGEPRCTPRHPPRLIVKGVTYHQLHIEQTPEGWSAAVYLDV